MPDALTSPSDPHPTVTSALAAYTAACEPNLRTPMSRLEWRALGIRLWVASHELTGIPRADIRAMADDAHRRADLTERATFRTVEVPAYAHFGAERLIEARLGELTSGLCREVEEAQERIELLGDGRPLRTTAPDYQASLVEMEAAWAKLQTIALRDCGLCRAAVESARTAGIHTVPWAIASRYLVAGWL